MPTRCGPTACPCRANGGCAQRACASGWPCAPDTRGAGMGIATDRSYSPARPKAPNGSAASVWWIGCPSKRALLSMSAGSSNSAGRHVASGVPGMRPAIAVHAGSAHLGSHGCRAAGAARCDEAAAAPPAVAGQRGTAGRRARDRLADRRGHVVDGRHSLGTDTGPERHAAKGLAGTAQRGCQPCARPLAAGTVGRTWQPIRRPTAAAR
jgi:hypothetical protein